MCGKSTFYPLKLKSVATGDPFIPISFQENDTFQKKRDESSIFCFNDYPMHDILSYSIRLIYGTEKKKKISIFTLQMSAMHFKKKYILQPLTKWHLVPEKSLFHSGHDTSDN